ncbi:MAG: hypothetical protein ACK4QL_10300 [Pseudanabaenaceae cyanobacterium]
MYHFFLAFALLIASAPIPAVTSQTATQKPTRANPKRVSQTEIHQLQRLFPTQRLIPDQTFRVNLLECGTCLFVPVISEDLKLSIHLVQGDRIITTLPQSAKFSNWAIFQLNAVAFVRLGSTTPNEDGIIIISEHVTGIGREGAIPFPVTRVYLRVPRSGGGWQFQFLEQESETLTSRRVSTIAQAEKILREEFSFRP